MNIFVKLRAEYEHLTRVEKNIADMVLENPREFMNLSMTELSERSGVSQGSINNFSRKFSEGGFAALKLKIAGELSDYEEKPFAVIDRKNNIKDAMAIKIKENLTAFQNTMEINEEAKLKAVVDQILVAKKIEIYGIFRSGIVAKDFGYQLVQLGIPAAFVDDSLMCAVSASLLDKDCLVIVISSSGRTREMMDAAKIAKKNRVPVVCLTSNPHSPIAKVSDHVLTIATSGISISDRNNEIILNELFLIDTLCSYIRSRIDAEGKSYYKVSDILNLHNLHDV